MKIEQRRAGFQPVTLTLETPADVAYLIGALGQTNALAVADHLVRKAALPYATPQTVAASAFAEGVRHVDSFSLYQELGACLSRS